MPVVFPGGWPRGHPLLARTQIPESQEGSGVPQKRHGTHGSGSGGCCHRLRGCRGPSRNPRCRMPAGGGRPPRERAVRGAPRHAGPSEQRRRSQQPPTGHVPRRPRKTVPDAESAKRGGRVFRRARPPKTYRACFLSRNAARDVALPTRERKPRKRKTRGPPQDGVQYKRDRGEWGPGCWRSKILRGSTRRAQQSPVRRGRGSGAVGEAPSGGQNR